MVLLLHNCSYYSFFKISFVFSFKLEAIARLEAIANCPTCEESVSSQEVGGHRSGLPRRWLVSNHLRAHQPWGLRCWGGNRLSEKNSSSLCTHTHTPFCSFNNLLHLCFSMSILFFALWLWCIWLLKCTSLPFFRSSLVNLSAEAPQDKVLIEPLENHHFVQGDIQHAATIRNKAAQLSAFGQCPQGTVLDLTVLSRMLQKTTSSTKEEQHRTTKCYSEEKTRLEAIATRSKDATRGSWPYY